MSRSAAMIRSKSIRAGAALFASVGLLQAISVRADEVTLKESGSTLIYPLMNVWASEYAKTHPDVKISTAGTGSGAGISQALSGAVQIGASDAYMSDQQASAHPQFLNVPMAISAMTVNYNVPGQNATALKFDGPTLAGIYSGKIRQWDDKALVALNPGVALPHHDIIAVRRADGSGDTFVFTQYLSFSTPSWENTIGYGTSVSWPEVPGGVSADGNAGVLKILQQTPYSLTYLGVTFHSAISESKLGTALLKSYSGEFLLPTAQTIAAAAASLTPRTPPDERLTLVNAPGANCYPLVNYEYAVVSTQQATPAIAAALRRFLLWAIAPDEINGAYLDEAHFIALPAHIWVLSHDQIEKIR
jgi:phosphate transport system substrate-binding protein